MKTLSTFVLFKVLFLLILLVTWPACIFACNGESSSLIHQGYILEGWDTSKALPKYTPSESEHDYLSKRIARLQEEISQLKEEHSSFAEKSIEELDHLETTNSNLTAATLVLTALGVIIAVTVPLATVLIWLGKNAIKRILAKDLKYATEKINEFFVPFLALQYQKLAVEYWERADYHGAMKLCEKIIDASENAWGEKPHDKVKLHDRITIMSQYAYYCAEAESYNLKDDAIAFAKTGLERGIETANIDLVDNYLFVVMKLSDSKDDYKYWLVIYSKYREKLIVNGIRDENEIDDFDHFKRRIKQKLS